MKTTLTTLLIVVLCIGMQVQAQDVNSLLDQANSEYKAGNLEDARFALQQALNGINQAIGEDMLALIPDRLGDMDKAADEDNVTGMNTAFAGLFVSRYYRTENKEASVEIMGDSPLLSSINLLLSMPVFMASDPNQKRIKVDGQKALLTRNQSEDSPTTYEVQLVFGSTLFTFHTSGIDDQDRVLALLDEIPVKKIIDVAQ